MSLHTLAVVKRHVYCDSVTLMAAASRAAAATGVQQVLAVMATPANRELLAEGGLLEAAPEAGPDDLVIAAAGADEEACGRAIAAVEESLTRSPAPGEAEAAPRTLTAGAARLGEANLALISVPGAYAAREAQRALDLGLHVFLFSDNVPLAAEAALKQRAAQLGLLCMGPDCGTAIIAGTGLGFANAVRRGNIGIVAASGTGIQEVSCLIDRLGGGISHAIGTGGRDLSAAVGGLTTLAAIEALGADPGTRVIVLISKPPAPAVAQRVVAAAVATGKQVIACFPGLTVAEQAAIALPAPDDLQPPLYAATLEEAGRTAVVLAGGTAPADLWGEAPWQRRAEAEVGHMALSQRYLRALYAGGTLCDEAMQALAPTLGPVYSNIPLRPEWALGDAPGHTAYDLGDDRYTRGRPHPLIDQSLRLEFLARAAADPAVAVVLLDVVLGYGAHPDPVAELAPAIRTARATAAAGGGNLAVVCTITGTDRDPQDRQQVIRALSEAGVIVAPSNLQAARLAGHVAARAGARGGGEG